MSGSPDKDELSEGVVIGMDDTVRTQIEHPPVEERTGKAEQQHEEVQQTPQQDDYQHWVETQQQAYQHGEPGSSSSGGAGGGRRSPKDRHVTEGSPRDPELSSLSALSNFSTGLSVSPTSASKHSCHQSLIMVRSILMPILPSEILVARESYLRSRYQRSWLTACFYLKLVDNVRAIEYIRVRRGTWTDVSQI